MQRRLGSQFVFWPALAAASASEAALLMAEQFLAISEDAGDEGVSQEPEGATPGTITLALKSVRLRDFTPGASGIPVLLCTPLALHGAGLADLVADHSLVAALKTAGIDRLLALEWRSADVDMQFLAIDDYLADLNVLVDHLDGLVDLVGLCQGGWLSLLYAARFPAKVRKLVLAGAPVDFAAQPSGLSALADATPLAVYQGLVKLGEGRAIGRHIARLWGADRPDAHETRRTLQTLAPVGSPEFARLEAIFNTWNAWTLDLAGTYYLEVIEKLYRRNELAAGNFVALGQRIELSQLRLPMFLLAGDDDAVVAPQQLFALARLAGTPPESIHCELAPSDHLGLFMGRRVLEEYWPRIADWLKDRPHAS